MWLEQWGDSSDNNGEVSFRLASTDSQPKSDSQLFCCRYLLINNLIEIFGIFYYWTIKVARSSYALGICKRCSTLQKSWSQISDYKTDISSVLVLIFIFVLKLIKQFCSKIIQKQQSLSENLNSLKEWPKGSRKPSFYA